ncbi:helicase-associated domain-containing protein, partial [bacterium]|nr:helicase-associated domain-containing protein [candidate division CSSED10-310 bacterium]
MSGWEQEIVWQVVDAGGCVPADALEAAWGGDDPELDRRWLWYEEPGQGLARLRLTGILFRVRGREDKEPVYAMPEEYRNRMSGPEFSITNEVYAPYQYQSAGTAIVTDIYHYLKYIDQFRVRPLRGGRLPKRHANLLIRRLNEITPGTILRDENYITLLHQSSLALDVLGFRNGRFVVTPRWSHWVRKDHCEQVADVFRSWLIQDDPIDMQKISGMHVESAGLRHPTQRIKLAMMGILRRLPDHWVSLSDISRHMQRHRPFFYRPDHSSGLWRMVHPVTREPVTAHGVWYFLENRIIRYILSGPAAWMGLVTIGLDEQERPEGLLVTGLGRAILDGSTVYQNDPELELLNKVIVQPDFEILAPMSLVLSIRDTLGKIADLTGGGYLQRYRLSRESIARAMESGLQPEEILGFLESTCREALPENVRTSVIDWMDDFGKIEIQRRFILTACDEYLMQELISRPAINRFIGLPVGPAAALIADDHVESITAELKRVGYLPRLHAIQRGAAGVASISLALDPGLVGSLIAAIHSYLSGDLEGISQQEIESLEDMMQKLIHLRDAG